MLIPAPKWPPWQSGPVHWQCARHRVDSSGKERSGGRYQDTGEFGHAKGINRGTLPPTL